MQEEKEGEPINNPFSIFPTFNINTENIVPQTTKRDKSTASTLGKRINFKEVEEKI